MVAGYDTYHDSSQKGRSAGGFVASVNFAMSKWFSRVNFHNAKEEMSSFLAANVIAALKNWRNKNGSLPKCLIIYRDGVGEGNIPYVFEYEGKKVNPLFTVQRAQVNATFQWVKFAKPWPLCQQARR